MNPPSPKAFIAIAAFVSCFCILNPVHARSEDPVSRKIGAAGGSLVYGNKQLVVMVPAGAMAKEETVSLELTGNTAPNGNGYAFHIQSASPAKKPFALCWKLNKEQWISAKAKTLGIAWQDGQQPWYASKKYQLNEQDSTICFETKTGRSTSITIGLISQYLMIPETADGQPILVNQPVYLKISGITINKDWAILSAAGLIKEGIEELYVNEAKAGEGDMKDGSVSEAAYSSPYSVLYVAAAHVPEVNPVIVRAAVHTIAGPVVMVETSFTIQQEVSMGCSIGGLVNPLSVFTAMQGGMLTVSVMSDIEGSEAIATNVTIAHFTKDQTAYHAGPGIVFNLTGQGRVYSSDYYEKENGIVVRKYSNASLKIISITPLANHPGNAILEGRLEADLYHSTGSSKEKASVSADFRIVGTWL
jgi:hypothetical protein